MSLDPKDLRLKLDPEIHAGLDALSDIAGCGLAEYAEKLLAEHVAVRLHEATVLTQKLGRLGISRIGRESQGKHGKGSK